MTYLGDAALSLVESVSCDNTLISCTENASKESTMSCTKLGPTEQKSIKTKRHPDSVDASLVSAEVYKQEVISDGQVKVPLGDLTTRDILTSIVKNDTGFSLR